MDNKKRTRNLLLYLAIPIVLIIVAAIFLSTRQSDSPKTSELVQYFIDDKVESYTINYGSGAIEITLKEGEKPYPKTDSSAANSPLDILANSAAGTTDASGKSKTVIKGQLADIRLFIEEINAKSSPDEPVKYNYIRASDNSFLHRRMDFPDEAHGRRRNRQGNELRQGEDQEHQRRKAQDHL